MNIEQDNLAIANRDLAPLAGKRVLVVLGCFDLGGAERQAIHAADCFLRRQQADVEVWAFRPSGRASELCSRLGIPWRYVPERWSRGPLRWPMMIGRFARLLRRARPDILLPYTSFPNVICGLSWRLARARVCVWNQRDAGLDLGSPAVPWAVRNTPLFLSNSAVGADALVNRLRVDPRRVRVVRNAVCLDPPASDRNAWRAKLGVDNGCFIAAMVANLQKNKDHATLLRAWQIVRDRLGGHPRTLLSSAAGEEPEVRGLADSPEARQAPNHRALLVLAGRLDSPEPLERLIHELHLDDAVRLVGEIDDVSGLLAASDIAVFSSRSEGCPNGVLESMASGLAVVATDCPGTREAVGEAGAAWLAPTGDPQAMADCILQLADRGERRALAGHSNAERIQSEFTSDRMNAELGRLLSAALANRRWPPCESSRLDFRNVP
jgi:glycosyltransferase involved in cell wall biosynthesis